MVVGNLIGGYFIIIIGWAILKYGLNKPISFLIPNIFYLGLVLFVLAISGLVWIINYIMKGGYLKWMK